MSTKRPSELSAAGDAEIIISPDGEVIIFDLDKELLKAAEAFNPTDPRLRAARQALDSAAHRDPSGSG